MKKIIKNVVCIVIIIGCVFISYNLLRNRHEKQIYEEYKTEVKKSKMEASTILVGILENKNWERFNLSNNFRNNYRTKYDIIPEARKYKSFSGGYGEIGGKKVISIFSDVPESIFDLYGANTVTTVFDFEYNVNENNELDDIKLVKTYKINAMTAKPIEE